MPYPVQAMYSRTDLKRLFLREVGMKVDDVFVREFQRWLARNELQDRRKLPSDLHLWMIQKIHEYSRMNLA